MLCVRMCVCVCVTVMRGRECVMQCRRIVDKVKEVPK